MEIQWLLCRTEAVPAGDAWLGADERAVQARLKVAKRRDAWRLGRFTAKQLLSSIERSQALDEIQILAAEDGAPEAFVDGRPIPGSISITHRSGVAACVAARAKKVGCDLEAIEPRSQRFVDDFFTAREREARQRVEAGLRDRFVALTWSAKESALKVLRVGLRRDTRSVEVELDNVDASQSTWQPVTATVSPENQTLSGWWRLYGGLVLTVLCDDTALRIAGHDEQR
ncbi:MAG: 4'-phosphopantetheinyl transferase superfamily protein [Polyangiales bacterium]